MMRHLKGGNTDLKAGKSYSFLILFLFLSINISAQIPINGFCEYNSYQVPAGYDRLYPVYFNGNSNFKILLYSTSQKKLAFVSDLSNKNNVSIKEIPLQYEISNLKQLKNKNRFVFSSRKNRLLGLLNLSDDGELKVISTISFDSFPENLNVGNINNYGAEEFLVSGSGFEGLSFIYQHKGGVGESKIVIGSSFCFSTLLDLNNDGYLDIATCNLLERSLQFYYNDSDGNFELSRSFPSSTKIYGITSGDVDNDEFDDLLISTSNAVTIKYGDFQSSYKSKVNIQLKYTPEKLLTGDFNQDGLTDIAYINYSVGTVSLVFAKSKKTFYEEILYKKLIGLTDLISIGNELWFLHEEGELHSIKKFNGFKKSVNFLPAINPTTVQKFNYTGDDINDLCFIDTFSNQLVFLLRDSKGIPSLYYSVPVSSNHTEIVTDNTTGDNTLYCYSKGSRLIEIIKTDFDGNYFERKQLYSPEVIQDLKIKKVNDGLTNIFLTYSNDNRFVLGKFEYRTLSITFKQYPFVDRNVLHSEIITGKEPLIYYWKEFRDTLYFKKVIIKTGPNEYDNLAMLPMEDSLFFSSFSADMFNNKTLEVFSIIENGRKNFHIVSGYWKYFFPLVFPKWLNMEDENQVFFKLLNVGTSKYLSVYLPKEKSLIKFDLLNKDYKRKFTKIIDSFDAADYFAARIFSDNYQIVYSNKSKGCISIFQLVQ